MQRTDNRSSSVCHPTTWKSIWQTWTDFVWSRYSIHITCFQAKFRRPRHWTYNNSSLSSTGKWYGRKVSYFYPPLIFSCCLWCVLVAMVSGDGLVGGDPVMLERWCDWWLLGWLTGVKMVPHSWLAKILWWPYIWTNLTKDLLYFFTFLWSPRYPSSTTSF